MRLPIFLAVYFISAASKVQLKYIWHRNETAFMYFVYLGISTEMHASKGFIYI